MSPLSEELKTDKDRSCLGPMYSLALFGFWSTIFAKRNCLAKFRLLCPCVSRCGRGNGEGVHGVS